MASSYCRLRPCCCRIAFRTLSPSSSCAVLLNAGDWAWKWLYQLAWFDGLIDTFTPFALVSAIKYRLWIGGWITGSPRSSGFVIVAAMIELGLGITREKVEATFVNLTRVDTLLYHIMHTIGAAARGRSVGWVIDQQGAQQRS